jgi:hypothetical protein
MKKQKSKTAKRASRAEVGLDSMEIYAFFENLPLKKLEGLAEDAIASVSKAKSRKEVEKAARKMKPFCMDCTFPRLSSDLQKRLKDTVDLAEERFGSLSEVVAGDFTKDDGPWVNVSDPKPIMEQVVERGIAVPLGSPDDGG